MRKKRLENLIICVVFVVSFCVLLLKTTAISEATNAQLQAQELGYPIFVNGQRVILEDSFIKEGRTYIQLRELCGKMNVTVDWAQPGQQRMPVPGGNAPQGINITNPSFVYTNEVTNYYNTSEKINCVDITGIYRKYRTGRSLKYYFSDEGLIIEEEGVKETVPLLYNPSNERMYLKVDEFKEKVQPYLTDICMQAI